VARHLEPVLAARGTGRAGHPAFQRGDVLTFEADDSRFLDFECPARRRDLVLGTKDGLITGGDTRAVHDGPGELESGSERASGWRHLDRNVAVLPPFPGAGGMSHLDHRSPARARERGSAEKGHDAITDDDHDRGARTKPRRDFHDDLLSTMTPYDSGGS